VFYFLFLLIMIFGWTDGMGWDGMGWDGMVGMVVGGMGWDGIAVVCR
jgi:hypothetical protein